MMWLALRQGPYIMVGEKVANDAFGARRPWWKNGAPRGTLFGVALHHCSASFIEDRAIVISPLI